MPRKPGTGANPHAFTPHIPTAEEIAERCREIREVGFTDERGQWHDPWGFWNEEEARRAERKKYKKKPGAK